MKCPKCKALSGGDWKQCGGNCPMPMSPHYVKPEPARLKLVILESPYAGDVDVNVIYGRECVRDSLLRGEAPIASHLLYTQPGILDDNDPAERQHGIDAGLAWRTVAHCSVVYYDRGISQGMRYGIRLAVKQGLWVYPRSLYRAPVPEVFEAIINTARAAR